VTVSLNSTASNLVVGTYNATLWFTNLTSGIGQSRQYGLSVISPPTITTQPTNQAVLEGAMATFRVSATGGLPLYYQWMVNGTNLIEGGNISGSTTTNLVISNVSSANVGPYSVSVSNLASVTTSSNAQLTITPSKPVIINQPANQTAVVGGTAAFTVGVIGSTPYFYHWSFMGTNLDGATNATLVLNNVQLSQAGIYAVGVSNALGSVTSSNATLNVYSVPVITSFNPQSGTVGTTINIRGLNFDPIPGSNIIYFGAVKAVVTLASATNLVVTVPAGATYAPITETVHGLVACANGMFEPTFNGSGPISTSSFGSRLDLAGAVNTFQSALADLDGDGKPDLVTANGGISHSVSLFQNISTNGTLTAGSFAARVDLAPLTGASVDVYGMGVGDVDGDGKPDILVCDRGDNLIWVYRNISTVGPLTTNSFAAPVTFAVGTDPRYVRVADLDGDGRPDIVSANYGDSTISILHNIGLAGSLTTNSFAPAVNIPAGTGAYDLAIGDLDGDSKPDIAEANESGTVSLFRNASTVGIINTNSFNARVDLPASGNSEAIKLGDVDGDGKVDLVLGSWTSQTISVYRNISSVGAITTNSFAPRIDFGTPGRTHGVAFGDLNGDGKPDIACAGELDSVMSVFQNLSAPGSFTNTSLGSRVDFAAGWNPWGVSVGDLDGDGRPDIIFCNYYDSTVSIYQNVTPFGGMPYITSQPTNQTVAVGGTASFSVTAGGSTPLSYQWRFLGTNISGATNTTLILNNVQTNQAGNYAVWVTNNNGSILSSNALLTVNSFQSCDPPPAGLVGWWRGENNANDTIGLNNGTLMGGGSYVPGDVGQGFQLVNYGDYVNIPASPSLNVGAGGSVTLEAWINPSSTSSAQPIFDWLNDGVEHGIHLYISQEPVGSADIYANLVDTGNTSHRCISAGGIVQAGVFQHVAMTYNQSSGICKLYYNGALVVSNNLGSFTPKTITGLSLGERTDNSEHFAGVIDEPSVYNRALSDSEILAIYTAGSGGKCTSASAPVITAQPTNQTVAVGGTASFSITASGNAPLSYFWRRNGAPINGANGTNYTLNNVQLSDSGSLFSCIVSNTIGSALSSNALLKVVQTVANDFCSGAIPISSSTYTNTQSTVPATSLGDPVPSCIPGFGNGVWYKYSQQASGSISVDSFGSDFDTGLAAYTGSCGSLIEMACNDDAGGQTSQITFPVTGGVTYYILVGGYSAQVGNLVFHLTSLMPPVIVSQPTNQTVAVSGTASFSVTAGGSTPLRYQWRFMGTNISGATNTTLSLSNVQTNQAGNYAVSVTNNYGSILSSNALLTVNAPSPSTNVPVIIGFNPKSGFMGSSVTVLGTNFSPVISNNIVYFGAVRALVIGASVTNLVVIVPVGATYAPITETVNGLTAYANAAFQPTFMGAGTITSSSLAPSVNLGTGNGPAVSALGDLDGDGKPDLVVNNVYDGSVWIYRNISTNGSLTTGSFASPVILSIGGGSDSVWGLALADLNGDGRLDIVVANRNFNNVSIFQNLSVPGSLTTNSFAARVDLPVAGTPNSVAVADLNGDGLPDIVTADQTGNTFAVLKNRGITGSINTNSFATAVYFAVGTSPSRAAIADLDGDGKPDVITVNYNSSSQAVAVFQNLSTGGSISNNSFAAAVNFPGPANSQRVAIGDIDGDGKLDMVIGSSSGGQVVAVYRNVSVVGNITTNSFAPYVGFGAGGWVNGVSIADLDGDGRPDVAAVTQLPGHLSIFKNVSTPGSIATNSFVVPVSFTSGSNPNDASIGDLDGDGRPDIVFANTTVNTLSIYHNIVPFGTPPAIISQPKNLWATLGCDVTFNVLARGTPTPKCQWWKGVQVLNGQTNLSLTLTNIQPSDFASYSVVVTNVFGSVTSSPAQLALGGSPIANADTIYRFASGGVRVNVNDLLGNDTDPDGNYLTIIAVSPNSAGGGTVGLTNNWVYYAPPAGPTNSDTFTYVVSDGYCGTDTGTVTVQIKADDPQPLTFAIANPGSGSVQLAFNGIPGNTYRIEYTDSLSNPNWQTITTQKVDAFGVCQFVDGSLTNVQTRFYRAVWP